MGGATDGGMGAEGPQGKFYPRSPWGERRIRRRPTVPHSRISIHAPHGGSDAGGARERGGAESISIHAPQGGSDLRARLGAAKAKIFLSTLPMGGATAKLHKYTKRNIDGIDK